MRDADKITASSTGEHQREQIAPVKAAWVRPTLDVTVIFTATQAGGAISADQDPNQPS